MATLRRTELRDCEQVAYVFCWMELFPFLTEFKGEERPLGSSSHMGFYVNRSLIGRRVPRTNLRCTHIHMFAIS